MTTDIDKAVERLRGQRLSFRTVFDVKRGDVLRATSTFHNPDVLTKGDIVIVVSVGDDGNIVFSNLFRPTIQCGLNPDSFVWINRPVTTLVPDYVLSQAEARAKAAEEVLRYICENRTLVVTVNDARALARSLLAKLEVRG